MTKQEIKELVSKKIAGQGSQVDIGGALAEILNGIIDIAGAKKVEVPMLITFEDLTKAQAAAELQISESDLDSLFEADVVTTPGSGGTISLCLTSNSNTDDSKYAGFGSTAGYLGGFSFEIHYNKGTEKYSASYTEV